MINKKDKNIQNSIKEEEENITLININKNNKYIKKDKPILTIILIISIFILLLISILSNYINNNEDPNFKLNYENIQNLKLDNRNISDNIKFYDILPKISLEQNNNFSSLDEILNSRQLFINDADITKEYIRYIKKINDTNEKKYRIKKSEIKPNDKYNIKRKDQYDYNEFVKLSMKEKLIKKKKFKYNKKPLISVILSSYNKENILMKSIRSIQNQNFKNIEIIIADDCSTDNSKKHFKYLLEKDPRIRVFTHLKNMGLWRSRIDGFLYSRAKYILFFDTSDFYEDNYVLDDLYNLMNKYNLDSAKMIFRIINSYKNFENSYVPFHVNDMSKIVYETEHIEYYNKQIFGQWANIWNRITRVDIYAKGLCLLNDKLLNIYKNMWEDIWFNTIVDKVSYNFTIIERVGYVYYWDGKGIGTPKTKTESQRNTYIQEYLGLLYFDYHFLPKNNNKKKIIKKLREYNSPFSEYRLSFLKNNFHILNDLIRILISDFYVSGKDKIFLRKILKTFEIKEYKMQFNNKILHLIEKFIKFFLLF